MADASSSFSASLRELGFEVGRFKTGTPCRLNGRSIDLSRCALQPRDEPPAGSPFNPDETGLALVRSSPLNRVRDGQFHVEQLPCWITHTTRRRTKSSGRTWTSRRFTPGESKGSVRDIAPRSRTRWSSSPTRAPHISFSSNRKDATPKSITSTGSRPACRMKSNSPSAFDPRAGAGRDHAARLCRRIRLFPADPASAHPRNEACQPTLLCRSDQRHFRV